MPPQIHAITELCSLSLVTVLTLLRTRWIGVRSFFRHPRSLIKVVTLAIMIVDAVVVIVLAKSHFRVTRCLRYNPGSSFGCFFGHCSKHRHLDNLQVIPDILGSLKIFRVSVGMSLLGFPTVYTGIPKYRDTGQFLHPEIPG